MRRVLFLVAAVLAVIGSGSIVHGGDVTYDGRSLIIGGRRKIVFSGSIHYPRSTPEIENEYGTVQKTYGQEGLAYVQWATHMVEGLQTGVPWAMCKQNNAPDRMINSCNGMKCGQTFAGPNSPDKPAIWTENWTTHYQVYGEDAAVRSVEDIAFHVTLFIAAKKGSFVNYYMKNYSNGVKNSGAFLERRAAGLRTVMIRDKQNNYDFTNYSWEYQIGLQGETLQIYTEQGSSQVQWKKFSYTANPLTWYKTQVDAPPGDAPVTLNLASMGKGEAWVNGQSTGGYWPSYRSPNGSAQTWYNVPRSFLKPTGNLLVLLEENG